MLDPDEEKAPLAIYLLWLKRVCIVATETCFSQGDIIQLTKDMIDRKNRVIVPEDGRVKTGAKQTAPLTDVVLEVPDEIEKDKKCGVMVPNIEGLVFTRADGRAIDKDMSTGAIKRARKKAGVKDFRFHDYRHSAKTRWSRRNIQVDIAMLAAGHSSVQMHKRYVNLKKTDVAEALDCLTVASGRMWRPSNRRK